MGRNVVAVDSRARGMYAKLEFTRGSIRLRRLTFSPDSTQSPTQDTSDNWRAIRLGRRSRVLVSEKDGTRIRFWMLASSRC